MTFLFDCPRCDGAATLIPMTAEGDEVLCEACNTRVALAPDPAPPASRVHDAA